jgi:hypothetical protein
MVWDGVAILSTLNLCVCALYAAGVGAWWLWVAPCLWASFCLLAYGWPARALLLLLLPVYFQTTGWLLPALLYAGLRASAPPLDRFTAVVPAFLRAALGLGGLVAVHGALSDEHDLMAAPLFMAFVLFSVAWAMWARFDRTNVSYFVLAAAAVHAVQGGAFCLAPRLPAWVVWGGPALFYFLVSTSLWAIVAVHASRIKGEKHVV